ncbi:hypothetical protein BGW80DRAFT_1177115 [Lactifluus volemus]|nr:hypothetical protein BGW80DRAFT_1177115 [Lactifluus volemus]
MSQEEEISEAFDDRPKKNLTRHEIWWVERYQKLETAGYKLRPRYDPDWRPSWGNKKRWFGWIRGEKQWFDYEDGLIQSANLCMDATQTSDGRYVILKKVVNGSEEASNELRINRILSESPRPENHCAQLLHEITLDGPNDPLIMVHPLLRPFDDPPLQTYGEFVSFFSQICEGLRFMHQNNVAHRDFTRDSIMLDPSNMYPESFHPVNTKRSRDLKHTAKGYSRTKRPTRYVLVGFAHSRQYDPANGDPLDMPRPVGDEENRAPEKEPCNPYHTDVYYLGEFIRTHFIKKYRGLEFMKPLVAKMVKNQPETRPTMEEVVNKFSETREKLGSWKLRSRMARDNEIWLARGGRTVGQWGRTVSYLFGGKAAIPDPTA